ncbi:hypothetical protein MTR_8g028595 [Medicago truncatula]|uniref:Uncharacterized protein n=1 Tax=Medicago truncatula TaxID=3880 RepID=A0A072TZ38_MEDTR|nr:hypothetical protein MTR_8g028595 [Medicago truncatula]
MSILPGLKSISSDHFKIKNYMDRLEVLAQLANAEITRPNVVIQVRTRDLTVV